MSLLWRNKQLRIGLAPDAIYISGAKTVDVANGDGSWTAPVEALSAVLAQRLVRIYCTACRGSGCGQCRGTGYRGRKAIGELLVLNDELRELIIARAPARKLKEVARAAGTLPLREAAMRLVNNAETSLEEINRVTFVA